MKTGIVLITNRLFLEPLTYYDSDLIHQLVSIGPLPEFIDEKNIHSEEDAEVFTKKILADPTASYWVARTKKNNEPTGIVTWTKRDYLPHGDVGFALFPRFRQMGYSTESVTAVVRKLFRSADQNTIFSVVRPDNIRALMLLKKLNFEFQKNITVTGETQQLHRITAEAWQNSET